MKKFNLKAIALFLGVTVSVTLTSCSEEVSNPTELSGTLTPVNISVSDFSIYMEDFSGAATRSEDPANYNGVKAMILAFYTSNGTEIYKSTQLKGSTDNFGQFSCDLPIGTYTLVVLGYTHNDGDVLDLTSPTAAAYTTERTRETFCATQSVTVTGSQTVVGKSDNVPSAAKIVNIHNLTKKKHKLFFMSMFFGIFVAAKPDA